MSNQQAPISVNPAAESESQYFDSFVSESGEFNPFKEQGWKTIRTRFEDMVRPQPGSCLLDVGCGTGMSRQLYTRFADPYIGIDLSEKAIAKAKADFPESNWQVADACALPFEDSSFDIVAFSSVLHHIPDFGLALKEAYRVLKPGGKVFAFDPNRLHPAMRLFRDPTSKYYNPKGVSPNERPLLPLELWRAFEVAGFDSLKQRAQSNIPYRAVAPKLMNTFLSAYNVVDWLWETSGLGYRFGTFVITVGQKPPAAG